ncbi:MAG: response regulator [Treponema sp.]|jgi:DNA-binding response OmpR family regulator|nr:response regulator [Treponema sp.]
MKQILIIDETPLFREYLRIKLTENEIEVSTAVNALDGVAKIRNLMPDLVIMDYHLSRQGCFEVLQQKKNNPNTVKIPVIILAQRIDQKKILDLVPFNVKKVFTKPVKIDALFVTLKDILQVPFAIDESPGIVEVHVNDDIIFIEIAQGLNRDKLDLLRFKIVELIELYEIHVPKVIVMISDMKLGFADAPNMKKLLDTIMQASRARRRFIRLLTRDEFARQFIEEQKEYSEIEVVSNLQYAMDGLLAELDNSMEYAEKKAEIISDRVLSAGKGSAPEESMALRFDAETKSKRLDIETIRESVQNMKIAVVDDDFVIQELIKNTFEKTGAPVATFSDGGDYLAVAAKEQFALVFLDLMMPVVDGFAVLNSLRNMGVQPPVIVLSAVTRRDTVIKAFQMGVKSYLTKPLKPDDIFKKAMEILKPNF